MSSAELRRKFLEFFEKRGHKIMPSSSLIPDDPSVLLTTAGMQQFKKYYTDPSLAPAPNVASVQKCFRTSDIDEVGDEFHLTFFEMLGNFSFGGYFKDGAIKYAKEFLESLGLKIEYVTVFAGDKKTPFDEESFLVWEKSGIRDIRKAGREDNFWGPTGQEGPCGPTTEIYIDGVEIWNIVFNEYYQKSDGKLEKSKTRGVDTGMGLERLAMVLQKKKNIFETDLFAPLLALLPVDLEEQKRRIIADHARAIAFLISDGVRPSNKEAGYILRRLMRRLISYGMGQEQNLFETVVKNYQSFYPELNPEKISNVFGEENIKFGKTLNKGLAELQKLEAIDAKVAFRLYESYGLPFEVIKEYAPTLKREDFEAEFKKHQEISRAGQEKKFGGHGFILNTGELKAKDEEELKKVTRLHTATHLLQAALRKVLGPEVKQMGSDITAERTRFDFAFSRKLTAEELKKVEALVNEAVSRSLKVGMQELDLEEAKKTGALHFFREKYPARVKVYSAGDFSKEICGGPHVSNTREVGKFVILKEEAVASGVRRIRANVLD
ncbi:MAG: alanine--tRNA ligase [Patescibacteria group bacterium]